MTKQKNGMKCFKGIWNLVKVCGMVFTVLLAVAYVASAYGGMANPEETTRYAILNLGYPILFIVSWMMFVVWIVCRQWIIATVTAISLVVTIEPMLTYFPVNVFTHKLSPQEQERSFKLLTFNVMNFDDFDGLVHEHNRTVQYILDVDADVVCLQEGAQQERMTDIKVIKNDLSELLKRYPYYTRSIDDMVLLSKYPFDNSEDCVVENRKKVVAYEVYMPWDTVKIFNCHLHSIGLTMDDKEIYRQITNIKGLDDLQPMETMREVRSNLFSKLSLAFSIRGEQARQLRDLIDKSGKNVIVCGDFNDTPGSYCYRTVRGNDLRDAYLDCAFGPAITYHDNRFYFKIDHVLYRGGFKAVDIERGKIDSSDHYPLIATFVWE